MPSRTSLHLSPLAALLQLVCLQHHVTHLLESNSYVRCIVTDFSKGFNTIDHAILLAKLDALSIPKRVLNWII